MGVRRPCGTRDETDEGDTIELGQTPLKDSMGSDAIGNRSGPAMGSDPLPKGPADIVRRPLCVRRRPERRSTSQPRVGGRTIRR